MEKRERKEQLKQRLRRYTSLKAERQQLLEQYNALTDPRGASLDGMPKGPGAGDPLAGIATKRQALANRYLAKLEEMAAEQSAIEDMIEGLEPTTRRIMRHKYIEDLTWEEVCVAVNYSWRQTHNLHDQALEALLAREEVTT